MFCNVMVEILQQLQLLSRLWPSIYHPHAPKGRAQIPEPHRFSVPQWRGCDSQRTFVLQGSRAKKEKVRVFLLWAAVPWLCTCHHVLGKYFDVILAFWRLIPPRAPLDVEARILQSAHAELNLKERINPNEITLIKTMGENYRSAFGMHSGNRKCHQISSYSFMFCSVS